MFDNLANVCVAAGIIWAAFIGYRLYFNVPDIEDANAFLGEVGDVGPSEEVLQELYREEPPASPDIDMDDLVAQLDVTAPPSAAEGVL
jgi:hypothetical protein